MFETVFQRDSTGIHLGTNQYSAVGEDSYTPVVFLTQFVQKGCYTGVKVSGTILRLWLVGSGNRHTKVGNRSSMMSSKRCISQWPIFISFSRSSRSASG